MKKLLLGMMMACAIYGYAQKSIIPEVVDQPKSGWLYLRSVYPYILTQNADPVSAGNWINQSKNTFIRSHVPGYFKQTRNSSWDVTEWIDFVVQNDSIILDNQDRIDMVFENIEYNYPGFASKYKYRYKFTYDSNNRPIKIVMKSASPVTSENYVDYVTYFLTYDISGKRISDTMYYEQSTTPYISKYTYDNNNHLIQSVWIDTDPAAEKDTTNISYYTYAGNNMTASYNVYYDADLGDYTPQSADSFTYDAQNRIISTTRYVLFSINGTSVEFRPYIKDFYTYSTTNKLIEMQTQEWIDDMWKYVRKSNILYNSSDEPSLGYVYPFENNVWSVVPNQRILFNEFTGVKEALAADDLFLLYPNPTNDMLHIQSSDKSTRVTAVQIMDISGAEVLHINMQDSKTEITIPTTDLNKGIYFVRLFYGDQYLTRKIAIE